MTLKIKNRALRRMVMLLWAPFLALGIAGGLVSSAAIFAVFGICEGWVDYMRPELRKAGLVLRALWRAK